MVQRFVALGECMIELSQAGNGLLRQGFAGDTLNTAWYARALLPAAWAVDYATVLGHDPASDQMLAELAAVGIGTGRIARHPTRVPGLYLISLSEGGERSFTYWRDTSAARTLADDAGWLSQVCDGADAIYVSGITYAILLPEGRARLRARLAAARQNGQRVIFDPNLRPRLWPDAATMCHEITAAAAVADIVLPSHDDEAQHFGDASPRETALRYRDLGAAEVLVKNGGGPMVSCLAGHDPADLPPLPRVDPVDTTGAGDSFNGGYLAARLCGMPIPEAAQRGHAVAMRVVGHRGALMPMAALSA